MATFHMCTNGSGSMFFNSLMEMTSSVADINCIAQITFKLIYTTLSANDGWFSLLDSKWLDNFWTREYRLYRPFAVYDHMVQKPPCWRANYPLGHPKQNNIKLSCFVLDVPVGSLLSSMAVFVPRDQCALFLSLSSHFGLIKRKVNKRLQKRATEASTF